MPDQLGLAYPTAFGPGLPYVEPRQPGRVASLLGNLSLATPPIGLAVTLADAKLHCRVDHADEDGVITDLIYDAADWVEKNVDGHRQLLTATFDVDAKGWWCQTLCLPRPPLRSVAWVKYYATDGTLTTLATSYYAVRTPWRQPGAIDRAPNQMFPPVQCDKPFPVTVRFSAGYGAAADIPRTLRRAILLLVGHWYANREAVGSVGKEVELALNSCLDSECYGSHA